MSTTRITELVGVYDADGTVRGELTYLIGRTFGRAHCALCDISHGALRRRREFDRAMDRLAVPVRMLHRDELTAEQARVAAGSLPCILAATAGRWQLLLDRVALEAKAMTPDDLVDAISTAAAASALELEH